MKRRTNIYISEHVWIAGVQQARNKGTSFSRYVEDLLILNSRIQPTQSGIERALQELHVEEKKLQHQLTIFMKESNILQTAVHTLTNIYHHEKAAQAKRGWDVPTFNQILNRTKGWLSNQSQWKTLSKDEREKLGIEVAKAVFTTLHNE